MKNSPAFSNTGLGKLIPLLRQEKHSMNDYLYTVLNSTREPIFLLDTVGNIKVFNEYAQKLILLFTGSDIRHVRNLIDAVPEWRKQSVTKFIKKAAKGKAGDYEVLYPSGRWLEVSFFPVCNDESNIREICCTLKDITKRKDEEEQVKRSEEMYRCLIESMQEGVFFQSSDNENNMANASAADILGVPGEKLIRYGLHAPGLIWIDQKGELVNLEPLFCPKLKHHKSVRNIVLGLKRRDTITWLMINAEPVKRDNNGNIRGCVFTFTDITESMKIREELTLLSKVIKETSNMVVITDKEQKIIWANDSFFKTSEYTLEEALNHKPGQLLSGPEKDLKEVKKIKAAIQQGKSVEGEILNYSRTGKKYWSNYNIHPVKDDEGNLVKYFSIQSDITELKRIQDEIVRQQLEYHELVTQATIAAQEEKQNQIGQELHDNVSQILAVTKMYLGPILKSKGVDRKNAFHVNEYIQLAIDEIRKLSHQLVAPQLKEKHLAENLKALTVIIPPPANVQLNVIELEEKYLNPDSRLALYRIAQEQLNNINKHAKARNCWISVKTDKQQIWMTIEDDGKGFDTAKKRDGIGIRNIYNRAESLNGDAEIISIPGKGCKLIIRIPVSNS